MTDEVRCPTCGSYRNRTEPRCLNVACPAHRAEMQLPYPWCFQPKVCAGRHSCPKNPSCGD